MRTYEWVHFHLWFKKSPSWVKDSYMTGKNQKEFEFLIRTIVYDKNIRRKFFLYEPDPHCFIAIETKSPESLRKYIYRLRRQPYISRVKFLRHCNDKINGEGFLNCINAFTDFYLKDRDNKLTHVVHCCLEFIFASRLKENKFYKNMALLYQGKRIRIRKSLRKPLRKQLRRYITKLNFNRK